MLLDLAQQVEFLEMQIKGVVHVGAHLGEEAPEYERLGIQPVWWIEANPDVIGKLTAHLWKYIGHGHTLIQALVSDTDGELKPFHVTNYDGMSSSVYEFGTHPNFSPDTVFEKHFELETVTLDTLDLTYGFAATNMLVMDIQGHEGPALRGATQLLKQMDYVMLEVNQDEVYVGCTKVDELDVILSDFDRVATYWVPNQGWGDALWIRK